MAGPGGGGALSCERSVPRQGGRPSSSEELPWPEVDDPGSPREVCWPAEDPHECAAIHLDWFDAGLIAVMSTRGQEHLAASDARALLADPAAWSPSAIAEHSIRRNCRKRDGRLWATARACRSQRRHNTLATLNAATHHIGEGVGWPGVRVLASVVAVGIRHVAQPSPNIRKRAAAVLDCPDSAERGRPGHGQRITRGRRICRHLVD